MGVFDSRFNTNNQKQTKMKTAVKTAKKVTNVVTKNVVLEKKVATKTVKFLKEGVTGKQLMQSIYGTNANIKANRKTFSQCLKEALEQIEKDGTFSNVIGFNSKACTPANLIPLRNEKRVIEGAGWSPYEVLTLIKKFYQVKK